MVDSGCDHRWSPHVSSVRYWIRHILLLLAALSAVTTVGTIGKYWSADSSLTFESAVGRSIGAALFPVTVLIAALIVGGRRTKSPPDRDATPDDSP